MRSFPFALFLAGFVSIFQIHLSAQVTAPAEGAVSLVEVEAVKFASVRVGNDSWLETEIEVSVKPGGKAVAGEFVDRVRVTLSLMMEGAGAGKRSLFYRASAEAISLEGGKATLRFYLPPEVVKRDRLKTDAKYYVVEVEAGGVAQPMGRASFVTPVSNAESVKNFLTKVSAESSGNEGVLMPQHLTPFSSDARRSGPTILRREPQR